LVILILYSVCEITKIVLKSETFILNFCFSRPFFVFLYDEVERW